MAKQIEIRDNTKEILEALNAAKHKGLEAIGLTAEGHAKKLTPVDTGRLRNSITYVVAGYQTHVKTYRRSNVVGGIQGAHTYYDYGAGVMDGEKDEAVYIGTNVEYAPYVEQGARGRAGVHMLQRAATEHSAEYKRIMEDALKNG